MTYNEAATETVSEGASSFRSQITSEGTHRDAFEAQDWGQLVFAAAVWGASFLFIATAVKPFGPGVVTFVRIVIGAITLGLFPAARGVRIEKQDWPRIVLVGITWLAFPMTLFPIAQKSISSGLAGMLNGSITLFAAIVGSFALRRLPGRAQLVGLIVGALGIVLLGIPALGDGSSSAIGVILVVVACASYGVAVTINVPLAQKYGTIPTFWRAQLVAVVLTLPFGTWGLVNDARWDTKAALSLFVLGAFGTALAFVAMVGLSKRVGSTRASSLTYLEAVLALVFGVVFRGEHIRGLEVIGCGVLLLGAWLVSRSDQ